MVSKKFNFAKLLEEDVLIRKIIDKELRMPALTALR